ncbi:molybdenum ABC transporter substrate-binding protein [Rhodoferax lacus]|uniref:Molybdenum ABC transporter substrate-binding protein n=2 Tax=Rhodoferax lacus TaxID=2184758 RepID=A0A3E1RD96_9BURK|nr:molybdenum ABC transporter substrate-binding protein [Rhodoferax lacus]
MATRQLLTVLLALYAKQGGSELQLESVGGVDAAKRVRAGEVFDIVFLASDAIDKLVAAGHLDGASRVDLAHSGVALAVKAGAPRPDISTAEAVRAAVLAARNISYSTGPSGVALAKLFEDWGITGQLQGRIVTAPPGVPVGSLVASGEVELGFQQLSELMHLRGITLLGNLPEAIQITTTFSAAIDTASPHQPEARALLQFLNSAQAADTIRQQGMDPARA